MESEFKRTGQLKPVHSHKQGQEQALNDIFANQALLSISMDSDQDTKASQLKLELDTIQKYLRESEIRRLMHTPVFIEETLAPDPLADNQETALLLAQEQGPACFLFLSLAAEVDDDEYEADVDITALLNKTKFGGYRYHTIINALRNVVIEQLNKNPHALTEAERAFGLPAGTFSKNVFDLFEDIFFGDKQNYSNFWPHEHYRYRSITPVLIAFIKSDLHINPARCLGHLEKFSPKIITEVLLDNDLYEKVDQCTHVSFGSPKIVRAVQEIYTPDFQSALNTRNTRAFRKELIKPRCDQKITERLIRQIVLRYNAASRPRNFWENRLADCLSHLMHFVGPDQKLPIDRKLLKECLGIINHYTFEKNIQHLFALTVNGNGALSLGDCVQATLREEPDAYASFTKIARVVPEVQALEAVAHTAPIAAAVPMPERKVETVPLSQKFDILGMGRDDLDVLKELISSNPENVPVNITEERSGRRLILYVIFKIIKHKETTHDAYSEAFYNALAHIILSHPDIEVIPAYVEAAKSLPEIAELLEEKLKAKQNVVEETAPGSQREVANTQSVVGAMVQLRRLSGEFDSSNQLQQPQQTTEQEQVIENKL